MKKRIAVFLAALMLLSLCGCKSKAAKETDELILKIGEVTASSTDEVERAQGAYDALSDKEKTQVENYAVLEQAQKDLAEAKRARAISEFEKFAKNTPYKAKEGGSLFEVDTELIEKYAARASELREMGVTDEECPALLYADMVREVEKYDTYEGLGAAILLSGSHITQALEYRTIAFNAVSNRIGYAGSLDYTTYDKATDNIENGIDELDAAIAAVDGVVDMNAYGVKTYIDGIKTMREWYEQILDAFYDLYIYDSTTKMLKVLNEAPSDSGLSDDAIAVMNETNDIIADYSALKTKLDEKHAELFG